MKTLSIRQPWAWLIVNGHKDFENRNWPTAHRGPMLVHASLGGTRAEYAEVVDFIRRKALPVELPAFDDLERGGIVGACDITGCVTDSVSPWFFGPHGFQVANARPLPFKAHKGQLGFFNVNLEI